MNLSELLELSRAGFTKEDIFKLLGTNDNQQPPAPAADPVPDNQDSDPDPVPDPQQPDQQSGDERIKALETKLDYAINRLNYMAVQKSEQPDQPKETLDDILSSVVRGFEKSENKEK